MAKTNNKSSVRDSKIMKEIIEHINNIRNVKGKRSTGVGTSGIKKDNPPKGRSKYKIGGIK